jgi:hypothetical protein
MFDNVSIVVKIDRPTPNHVRASQWRIFLASHWRVLPSKGTKVYLIFSLKALFAPHEAQKHIGASSEDIARPVWRGVYATGG